MLRVHTKPSIRPHTEHVGAFIPHDETTTFNTAFTRYKAERSPQNQHALLSNTKMKPPTIKAGVGGRGISLPPRKLFVVGYLITVFRGHHLTARAAKYPFQPVSCFSAYSCTHIKQHRITLTRTEAYDTTTINHARFTATQRGRDTAPSAPT